MVSRRRISFAVSALGDLEEIRAFYSAQQVPEVGERLLAEILSAVERLADYPESGRVVPEFDLPQLREIRPRHTDGKKHRKNGRHSYGKPEWQSVRDNHLADFPLMYQVEEG